MNESTLPNRKLEITRAIADGAGPAAKRYRIIDTKQPGLFMRVSPSGVRVWYLAWARNRDLKLGVYPHVTVAMARERARKALVERDEAGAPAAVRPAGQGDGSMLVGTFVADHYAAHIRSRRKRAETELAEMQSLFGERFYGLPLAGVTIAVAESWGAARLAGGVKPATVRRNLVRLKALLSKAVEWGHIEASPIAKLKLGRDTPSGDDAYLTAEEEQALRAALAARDVRMIAARESGNAWAAARGYETLPPLKHYADHLTPMVLVAMNTGLRRGELTSLHWEHADLETAVITVLAGKAKSGKARHVPMNAEVVEVLKRWREIAPADEPRLFPIESPKTAWHAVVEEAGIGKFRFHDLRHHFASRLVMAGEDLNTVRELLGHADIATTLRYAHLAPEHKRRAVDALLTPLSNISRGQPASPLDLVEQIADTETLRTMLLKLVDKLA
ncbi:MAG: hypothetical protein AMXMBFR59_41120 [Rhodanobacteraceae bacterium]